MRNRRAFISGIGMAVLSVIFLGSYLHQREKAILELGRPVPVWCAAAEIKAFDTLKGKIRLRNIPMTYVRSGALVSLDPKGAFPESAEGWKEEDLSLKVAGRSIAAEEQIVREDLVSEDAGPLSRRIEQGRAMALSVDEITGIAGYVRPGDRVDVVGLFDVRGEMGDDKVARILVADKTVLAAGPRRDLSETGLPGLESWSERIMPSGRFGRDTKMTSVTLLLTQEESLRLSLAQEAGLLSLLLRGESDTEMSLLPDMRLSELGLDVRAPDIPRYREIRGQEIFGHQPLPAIKVLSEEGATKPES